MKRYHRPPTDELKRAEEVLPIPGMVDYRYKDISVHSSKTKRLKEQEKKQNKLMDLQDSALAKPATLIPSGIDQFAKEIGGIKKFLEGCRLVDNDKARRLVQLYESASNKKKVSIEDLCIKVDLDPHVLIGNVVSCLYALGNYAAKVVSATHLPEIVKAGVEAAKKPKGVEDRKMQFQIGGLLHEQKGVSINIGGPGSMPVDVPLFEEEAKQAAVDAEFKVVEE